MALRTPPLRLRAEREQAMLNRVIARTSLNDSREASGVRNVLAAAAVGDEMNSFAILGLLDLFSIDLASGRDLDDRAVDYGTESSSSLQPRRAGSRAVGGLEFTRTSVSGAVVIPAGTRAEKPGSRRVTAVTTVAGSISAGSTTSGIVNAVTEQSGSYTNASVGDFKKLVSRVTGVNAVNNPVAFAGGTEQEGDAEFRERIKNYIRTLPLCTPKAIEELAGQVELADGSRVVVATALERDDEPGKATLYIDNGLGTIDSGHVQTATDEVVLAVATGGERRLQLQRFPVVPTEAILISVDAALLVRDTDYFLMSGAGALHLSEETYPTGLTAASVVTATYSYYTGLIAETQWRVDGRQDDRGQYPGWRALGAHILVLPPSVSAQTVAATLTLRDGYDRAVAVTRAKAELSTYINTLAIGADIIRHEIIERIMGVPGVFDVSVTQPTGNVTIADGVVARVQDSGLLIE